MPLPNLETTDVSYMRRQFEAWMMGAMARADGRALHENPFPARSAEADSWENAWENIDDKLST